MKKDVSSFEGKHFHDAETFFSKLDWGCYIGPIAKTASKKIVVLIRSMKFFSLEVALYLYKSTI